MRLIDYIKKIKMQGITQGEFAERAGIHEVSLSVLLKGKKEPRISTMLKIVRASGGEVSHVEDFVVDRNGR